MAIPMDAMHKSETHLHYLGTYHNCSKVMHRKEVTHSNGSYERKSCGLKFADEMGRGKKSHDTLID